MATIYALFNTTTWFAYIGCTRSGVAKRFREHRCLLRAGRHTCRPLQKAWDVDGEVAFTIQELEHVGDDLESRRQAELRWMELHPRLFNEEANSFRPAEAARQKGVEASRHVEGRKRSPEANRLRSIAQKGIPKGHGAKISATKQARKLSKGDDIV